MEQEKKYQWKPETQFSIGGTEFNALLNGIRAILNSPESRKVFILHECHQVLEASLQKAIEEGKVEVKVEDKKEKAQ